MKNISKIIFLIAFAFAVSCNKTEEQKPLSNTNIVITKEHEDIPVNQEDNSLERVKNTGILTLGLDDTFAPMGFKDEIGDVVGFDIDLAREVAARMGVKLNTKTINWGNSTSILTNGEVDVLWNGLNINSERSKSMIFSKPYLNNMLIIVKYVDDETINSIDDLAGKVVAVQYGGNYEQIAHHPIISKIKELKKYDLNTDALIDLQNGRVDAVVLDDVYANYYIAEKKVPFAVVQSTPLTDGLYVVGFKKSDVKLRDEINRILDEMKADGTTAEISKKWFGKDIVLK